MSAASVIFALRRAQTALSIQVGRPHLEDLNGQDLIIL